MLRPQQFKAFVEEMKVLDQGLRELGSRYSEIRMPTVIVVGDSDQIAKPESHSYPLHRAIPHSELIVLKKAGHELIYTRPDAVLNAIDRVRNN
jgi:pimeloyl-ACP methyl ester carboxylesterase